MSDVKAYCNNLHVFLETIKGAHIERLEYEEDIDPADDISALQLNFKYCFSISFYTEKGNFKMMTAMTESAIETFWIEPLQNPINKTSERVINSKVISTSSKIGYDNYAFKIILELENSSLTIYAADIHDTSTQFKDIKINDEMLLAFESKSEAEKFEQMINHT